MARPTTPRGFTVVEVLVAFVVIAWALAATVAGAALAARLGARAAARAGLAGTLANRMAALEGDASLTPGCGVLLAGSVVSPSSTESWRVSGAGASRRLLLTAAAAAPGGWVHDSLATEVRCR